MFFIVSAVSGPNGYSWQLVDDRGNIAAEASRPLRSESSAVRAANYFRRKAPMLDLVVQQTHDNRYEWVALRRRKVVATSHQRFDSPNTARSAASHAANAASTAIGL